MNDIQLRRLDLTLLLVFEAALELRKLTKVAERLGLTQSAVSHALQRLRDIFGDPLFLRKAQGVEPTPHALLLAEPVAAALAQLRDALNAGRAVEPSSLKRVFRIAALDAAISLGVPGLLDRLLALAPNVQLIFRTLGREEALKALNEGAVDVVLGVFPRVPARFVEIPLTRTGFLVAARRGHPRIGPALDLETYLALPHLLVSAAGDLTGTVDQALEVMGRRRRVAAAVPQFLAAMLATARSDAILTGPDDLLPRHAEMFGLAIYQPPLELPGFMVSALRRAGTTQDQALDWFIDLIGSEMRAGAPNQALAAKA